MRLRPSAADRYAKALHDLAVAAGAVAEVARDLAAVRLWVSDSAEFRAFLSNYLLPRKARMAVLEGLMGSRLQPLTWQFVRFVESRRRLALLSDICAFYREREDVRQGILRARLGSAQPLEPAEQALLATRATQRTGRRVEFQLVHSPELLGGYRLQIEDTVYDFSLSARLRLLRERMVSAAV